MNQELGEDVVPRGRERPRFCSSTASRVEEIMFVRACSGLCALLGEATPPKRVHPLEPLFNEISKALA